MRNMAKNNKGMTLIEVILSIAVLGIISAPLLAVFTNSAAVIYKTRDRIELNAAVRIAKENVISSVKDGTLIARYDEPAVKVSLQSLAKGSTESGLEIRDNKNIRNGKYLFDAKRELDYGDIADFEDTCEFIITLKTAENVEVQKLRVCINNIIP